MVWKATWARKRRSPGPCELSSVWKISAAVMPEPRICPTAEATSLRSVVGLISIADGPLDTMPTMSPSCRSVSTICCTMRRTCGRELGLEVQVVDEHQQHATRAHVGRAARRRQHDALRRGLAARRLQLVEDAAAVHQHEGFQGLRLTVLGDDEFVLGQVGDESSAVVPGDDVGRHQRDAGPERRLPRRAGGGAGVWAATRVPTAQRAAREQVKRIIGL